MSTPANARRFTVAEYLRMAKIGILRPDERVELIDGQIDGQIVAMSPQSPTHAALVSRLSRRLMSVFPEDRFCVRTRCTMAAGEDYAPEPGLAVVSGRCEDHEHELPRTAVLVIEVADSSLRLDRGRKSDLYGRAATPFRVAELLPV